MPTVASVSQSAVHEFSKEPVSSILLIEGEGVKGDSHRGRTVQHRSRVRIDPEKPNLRQVHLIHLELIEELQSQGFKVQPSSMGENMTTSGIDLLSLPEGTLLKIGSEAVVKITGLMIRDATREDFVASQTITSMGVWLWA